MQLLLWFRALSKFNFYAIRANRNQGVAPDSMVMVASDISDLTIVNVGQTYQVVLVNRTTGEVGFSDA